MATLNALRRHATTLALVACTLGFLSLDGTARAADAEEGRAYELGELIAMSLPPRRHKMEWKHPVVPSLSWQSSIVGARRDGTGGEMRRTAQVDAHVLGERVTALAPPHEVLLWTMSVRGPPKRRPLYIELQPGSENQLCNSEMYEGCEVAVLPSLEKAGIRYRMLCDFREELFSIGAYEIATADGRVGYLRRLSGGGSTWLTITFSKSRLLRELCVPGTPRH